MEGRILVVEPDVAACGASAADLVEHGFHVVTAHAGVQALTYANDKIPDVALVELALPDMAGLDLVRQLKSLAGASIHVIAVTGQDDDVRVAAFEAGCDDYVRKPAPSGELSRRVQVAMRLKEANRRHVYGQEAAAILAHDLNNGLAVALSNVSFLNEEVKGDADVNDALVATLRSLQRMSGLVANFVDIARFEDATISPVAQRLRVRELFESVHLVSASTLAKGVVLAIECEAELEASLDPALIERVLHNVVGNATRYCPADGRIVLAARVREQVLEISVENTGPLVPEAIRLAVFERTVRGKGRKRGMGLYFCRLAVEAHGGTIDYAPGEVGPRFTIRLPAPRPS